MAHQRFDSAAANPDMEADIHGDVVKFLKTLDAALLEGDIETSSRLYESDYPKMTATFYSTHHATKVKKNWPQLKHVKHLLSSPQTELMYELIYFRSLVSENTVKPADRAASWTVYQKVFELLSSDELALDIPNGWLWDIVDELLFQMQYHRLSKRHKADPAQWAPADAIKMMQGVEQKSDIRGMLRDIAAGKVSNNDLFANADRTQHVCRVLGYFCILGIVRARVSLADYHGALAVAAPLEPHPTLSQKIPPAHTSINYTVGFCYMMLRRYNDAAAHFQRALQAKSGRKYHHSVQEQVVELLSMTCVLGDIPMLDVSSVDRVKDTLKDDLPLLAQGDVERFRDLFARASPKFITAQEDGKPGLDVKELQLRLFLREVQQQQDALVLRGYLQAYSHITVDKIATLRAGEKKGALESLITMKHKTMELVHKEGTPLSGTLQSKPFIDFAADKGSVTVLRKTESVSCSARFYDRIMALQGKAQ